MEAHHVRFLGVREFRDEAQALVAEPGDAVLVERGVPRALVIKCPDGCGEILSINLDRRSGKAWRITRTLDDKISLYPSVAKQGGCESHFVVRRSAILWCDNDSDDESSRSRVPPPTTYTSAEAVTLMLARGSEATCSDEGRRVSVVRNICSFLRRLAARLRR